MKELNRDTLALDIKELENQSELKRAKLLSELLGEFATYLETKEPSFEVKISRHFVSDSEANSFMRKLHDAKYNQALEMYINHN